MTGILDDVVLLLVMMIFLEVADTEDKYYALYNTLQCTIPVLEDGTVLYSAR